MSISDDHGVLWIFWIGCDVGSGFCGYFGLAVMWEVDFVDILVCCDAGSGFCGYFGLVVMWAVDFVDILDRL